MQKQNQKIGLIIFWYSIGISPSLINMVINLAKSGYKVHIFIDDISFHYSKIHFKNKNIYLHLIKNIPEQWSDCKSIFKRFLHQINVFLSFYRYCREISSKIDKDFFLLIGADAFGIIAARYISKRKNIPFIYYNLELLLTKECHDSKGKMIKSFEKWASQLAKFTIIQDRRRAKFLVEDNKLKYENIEYIPVSVFHHKIKKSHYLQKKFKISSDKKILLYAGEIEAGTMGMELVKSAQSWNKDFVLVMHASRLNSSTREYIKNMQAFNKSKQVYFSLNPVEWEKVPDLISSADIGLAFYRNLSKNYSEIGMSSGKIASYLQAGLPIITSDFPSLREIINDYKIGRYVKDPYQIGKAAIAIFRMYNVYHKNAQRCFKEKYDNIKYFPPIIARIKSLEFQND